MSYKEINIVEYNKNKSINFESNEIDKLSKYYPNLELDKSYTKDVIIIDLKSIIIYIRSIEDDFYTIEKRKKSICGTRILVSRDYTIYYKCDQLSGLLKCLKQITK